MAKKNNNNNLNDNVKGKRGKNEGDNAHKPNWRERYATMAEIEQFLSDHLYLRRNVVRGCVECRVPEGDAFAECNLHSPFTTHPSPLTTHPSPDSWQRLTDYQVNSLWRRFKLQKEVLTHDLRQVMESDFVPDFHPMRHYLEHLPPWDGLNHIMALSATVNVRGGADEQMRFYLYLRKWLVGMVAAWVDPEVVNHQILVLIGPQGAYKTTWFSYLLPPELREYFRIKTNASRLTKDDLLTLTQYALVCYEELDTMSPRDLNELKSAVTMPSVDERRPYGHYTEHFEHLASFCGTGNNVQFLSDPTGNRRWLPFQVESITSPRDNPLDYQGIYAEAYALYQQGFQYWFSPADTRRQAEHNRQFEVPDMLAEIVFRHIRRPSEGETGQFLTTGDIFQMLNANPSLRLNPNQMGRVMTQLGFERTRCRGLRGYNVVVKDSAEIQSEKSLMAFDAIPESG